jgi:peptidoglycan/xylan/chitin deacetylase (PgdA/CDA1 family)
MMIASVLVLFTAWIVALSAEKQADAAPSQTAAIFMYHHVSPTVLAGPYARALTVTPDEFRGQLTWLRAHTCRVVSVDALRLDAERHALAPCEAALTFDDGYDDAAKYAVPLLQHFGDVGTFYITTGYVDSPGHVTVAQLQLMRSSGMEIGAHTVHHVDLTSVSLTQATLEINDSAKSLQRWLKEPVTSFAYPAGQFNAKVVATVRRAVFDNAVTTLPGEVQHSSSRYELPRYRIERDTGLQLMQAVFGSRDAAVPGASATLVSIARKRIAGNAPGMAEGVAVALLARRFPEQILKVHVLSLRPATVAGIVLSGVKFHRTVNREQFEADVADMVGLAFSAAAIDEVDIWATVPLEVRAGASVSGDYAVPAAKTVFSAAVTRAQLRAGGTVNLGNVYIDPEFLRE